MEIDPEDRLYITEPALGSPTGEWYCLFCLFLLQATLFWSLGWTLYLSYIVIALVPNLWPGFLIKCEKRRKQTKKYKKLKSL
jgi:hypothetical protein